MTYEYEAYEAEAKANVLESLEAVAAALEYAIGVLGRQYTSEQIAFGVHFADTGNNLRSVYRASRVALPSLVEMTRHLAGCITWATGLSSERFVNDEGDAIPAARVLLAYLDDGCMVGTSTPVTPVAPPIRSRLMRNR